MFSLEYAIVHACNYTKRFFFILMLPLSHRLSGKFSLPRQLVPDIGKMLEKKIQGLAKNSLTFQVFQGAWQPCIRQESQLLLIIQSRVLFHIFQIPSSSLTLLARGAMKLKLKTGLDLFHTTVVCVSRASQSVTKQPQIAVFKNNTKLHFYESCCVKKMR